MVLSKTFCHSIHFKLFPFNYVSKYFKLYKSHSWQRGPNHPVLWRHSLYCLPSPPYSNTMWFFASTLIWYHTQTHTHTHTHTQRHNTLRGQCTDTHQHKYIFTPPVMCSQQLSLLHWMNNSLISKIYFPQCLFFSKIIDLQKSCIFWLDAKN